MSDLSYVDEINKYSLEGIAKDFLSEFLKFAISTPDKKRDVVAMGFNDGLKFKLICHFGIWRFIHASVVDGYHHYFCNVLPRLIENHKRVYASTDCSLYQKNRILVNKNSAIIKKERLGTCVDMCFVLLTLLFESASSIGVSPFLINFYGKRSSEHYVTESNHSVVALICSGDYERFRSQAFGELIKSDCQSKVRLPWLLQQYQVVVIDPFFKTVFYSDVCWGERVAAMLSQLELNESGLVEMNYTFFE